MPIPPTSCKIDVDVEIVLPRFALVPLSLVDGCSVPISLQSSVLIQCHHPQELQTLEAHEESGLCLYSRTLRLLYTKDQSSEDLLHHHDHRHLVVPRTFDKLDRQVVF
jgi:hypothetical protein